MPSINIMAFSTFALLLALLLNLNILFDTLVHAAPAKIELGRRQAFTLLSPAQISTFKPFTFFAASAACDATKTLTWSCGISCDANSHFQPIASGGDGDDVQFWYVGFDPILNTVVVGHEGTNPEKIHSILTDLDFFLHQLDSSLFPGISSDLKVHNGFAEEHAKSAPDVLAAVQKALTIGSCNDVTLVGHSLGAALALLDSIYLPIYLPGVNFRTVGYGMPRVGNQPFADYIDMHTNLTHINNKQDLVPTLPGRFFGFRHPQGEIHIQQDDSWISCPNQDNKDERCTDGNFDWNLGDHDGPYDGVVMRC